ncbi:MAG: hypothetical protein AAB790_01710 [Patescibacteria group bacterium]|mgnify:CR=1 FL=1
MALEQRGDDRVWRDREDHIANIADDAERQIAAAGDSEEDIEALTRELLGKESEKKTLEGKGE